MIFNNYGWSKRIKGDINLIGITETKPKRPILFRIGRWVLKRESFTKYITRHGVRQSMLKYRGVR